MMKTVDVSRLVMLMAHFQYQEYQDNQVRAGYRFAHCTKQNEGG